MWLNVPLSDYSSDEELILACDKSDFSPAPILVIPLDDILALTETVAKEMAELRNGKTWPVSADQLADAVLRALGVKGVK
jgi:hypothetical protein